MNLLQDIITYVRRLVKTPSNTSLSDSLVTDYINRFWLMDMSARMQLFDLKTEYVFQTTPGIAKYNMPLYDTQSSSIQSNIAPFPVYQGFLDYVYVNGIQSPFYVQESQFYKLFPNYVQQLVAAGTGNGTAGPYTLALPFFPAIPGHVDMAGIIATGSNIDPIVGTTLNMTVPQTSIISGVYITATGTNNQNLVVADSGQFLSSNLNYGLLYEPGTAPFGYKSLPGGYSTTSNTVDYSTGSVTLTFNESVQSGTDINVQCFFYQPGIPRALLYYNNVLTLLPPPNISYQIKLGCYLTPAAFLSTTQAIPFAYMAEYIARGAARKILSDTGDIEQFMFYEPLFKEQETLVWKRSQRIFTSTRTGTIFSDLQAQAPISPGSGGV